VHQLRDASLLTDRCTTAAAAAAAAAAADAAASLATEKQQIRIGQFVRSTAALSHVPVAGDTSRN